MYRISDFLCREELAIMAGSKKNKMCGCGCNKTMDACNKSMEALGGGGGGPAPERTTGAPGARLVGEAGFKKEIRTKAPPGMEDMVMKLKQKYGEDSSSPFKIAWSKYNEGK